MNENNNKNKNWKIIYPKTIDEVKSYLKSPKSHKSIVLYLSESDINDSLMFMLNPFGSGTCNTTELKLSDEWKLDNCKLDKIMIIVHK